MEGASLRFPLERGEELFGFGLNFQSVHQRGKVLRLHVNHYGGTDNGRTHAPTPFYISSNGYGVFVNAARYIEVYAGTASRIDSKSAPKPRDRNTDENWTSRPYSDAVEMLVPTAGVEVYVFGWAYTVGCRQAVQPVQWRRADTAQVGTGIHPAGGENVYGRDVEAEAEAFETRGYPLDFIGLEPGWQSKAYPCTFEWDKCRFPDPEKFIAQMKAMGVRINLWQPTRIFPPMRQYTMP